MQKKNGQHLNCILDQELSIKLREYSKEEDRTITASLERILKEFFENREKQKSKN